MKLVTRGDDAGLSRSVNEAIAEVVTAGVVRNVSVMVTAPYFGHAVELLRELPEVCVGLHLVLSSEWEAPRWGPASPADQVPSLTGPDGCFWPAPMDLYDRGPLDLEQTLTEVEAQLDRARSAGLDIAYLDEHMGVGWLPGLRAELARFTKRHGLVDADAMVPVLPATEEPGHPLDHLTAAGEALAAGPFTLITHPGYDEPELADLRGVGFPSGGVGRARDADRRALLSDDFAALVARGRIEPVRYDQL